MKKLALAAILALSAVTAVAAPSEAGKLVIKFGHHHKHHYQHGYWVDPYVSYNCWTEKQATYDDWGNVYVRKVRVCG